ncbi:exported hypothetical protein [Candidatus Sulfotelmatobacter sp. SbA7]|nr:exported hypothetical protein [Candidatus Sulfotelmatobacter sp. SbA7]
MKSKFQFRLLMALMGMLLVCFLQAGAEDKPPACAKGYNPDGTPIPQPCNGISVGAPKVFDNRTLTLMLESLSQALQAQQQNYIDQKSVAAALANIQGFTQTETSTNLSLTATPTPATDVKTTLNTGNVNASGTPLPNTFQRQTDVNRASVTPQAPALDTAPAFQGFSPTYGNSASDLLSDQVNLTYQIFNLRMILERSLSDRLLSNGVTRLQAVLGFNVTLDPPRTANDAVAVVEITLTSKDEKPVSLVGLMPQEKTYNAAALSNKSNAFAGSAVVSSFQVGFSARKRSQIFYLYRDTDTISYERMTGDPKTIVFGWMFRPLLGRRSISPGLRQLFAIMALPNVDCTIAGAEKDKGGNSCTANLSSTIRTYWKKYDRATLTSFESQDANRATRFWYGLSLGLAKPQVFDDHKYENTATYSPLVVESSATYQSELTPAVDSVEWRPIGAKNVIVSVKGNNLFTNTQVAIGDKIFAKLEDGLILKSNQGFDLVAPLDALVNGPGTVIGRYGVGVPLVQPTGFPAGFSENGVEFAEVLTHPSLAGQRKIEIKLRGIPSPEAAKEERDAHERFLKTHSKLEAVKNKLAAVEEATRALQSAKGRSNFKSAQKNLDAITAQLGDAATLKAQVEAVNGEVDEAKKQFSSARMDVVKVWRLNGSQDLTRATPVISVNGKSLEMPYYQSPDKDGVETIQANVPDSDLADGGGLVRVSWPFYPADKWTVSTRISNPDDDFQITRISQKSILIGRVDGPSFVNGPEVADPTSACWKLIAGDTELPLVTSACHAEPAPKDCQKKAKDDACTPPPLGPISDYTVTATVAGLPDKVVLVAPSGAVYNLTVPPLKAKDDKTVPIELKQYDSQWIEIKSSELTTSSKADSGSATATGSAAAKGAKDFSGLTAVEANNGPVNYVLPEPDPKVLDEKTKLPKPPASIKVEITRALTSKPGTVDLAFLAGKKLIGTRQIHIAQTEWGNKGDK